MSKEQQKLITFVPKHKRDAQRNINNFINMCRHKLTLFNDDRNWREWDDYRWPEASFVKFQKSPKKKNKIEMDSRFIDFAKAYARYACSHNNYKITTIMPCLRALESVLVEQNTSIDMADKRIFDKAARLLEERHVNSNACQSASHLEKLANFMHEKNLTTRSLSKWKHGIVRKDDHGSFDFKGAERLNIKLPSDEAMSNLAKVFSQNPKDPSDIFITSVWAILMSTGLRISEALSLSIDSLEEEYVDGEKVCYLRYFAKKRGGWNIVPIDEDMEDVIKEAFNRIKRLTVKARKLAKHLENEHIKHAKNPTYKRKIFPHPALMGYNPSQNLSMTELSNIIGLCGRQAYRLSSNKSNTCGLRENSINGIENWIHDCWDDVQPEGFPFVEKRNDDDNSSENLKYSDALFCFRQNEINKKNTTRNFTLIKVKRNLVSNLLSGKASFFVKHGIQSESGDFIKTKSHAPRHLLNTIMQNLNSKQTDIARMFGRADMGQNKVYDHTSDYERAEKSLRLAHDSDLFGERESDELLNCKNPIKKATYDDLNLLPTTHSTEYGLCLNDFSYYPCVKYRNCLSCSKHVIDVKNKQKVKQINAHYSALEKKLKSANDKRGSFYGVGNYISHLESEIKETKKIISAISDMGDIDDRFLHRLGVKDSSFVSRAIKTIESNRNNTSIEKNGGNYEIAKA